MSVFRSAPADAAACTEKHRRQLQRGRKEEERRWERRQKGGHGKGLGVGNLVKQIFKLAGRRAEVVIFTHHLNMLFVAQPDSHRTRELGGIVLGMV